MFEMDVQPQGTIRLAGRFDAAAAERAHRTLAGVTGPVTFECSALDYISSAGIGVLIETYKRLHSAGHEVRFTGMLPRVRSIFAYAGLDRVLQIDE